MSARLTVAQAIVRFLEVQYVERDGVETPFFAGCWGIFGHGNVAGVGQALLEREHAENAGEAEHVLRYHQARNEQAMVHAAVGYARHRDRLAAFVCSASVGPGSTNMVTGAALATINRIPVLLLPGDVFATRVSNPVLQEIEDPRSFDVSVNDCFKPVSRFWDRINRPEQLPLSLLAAMRVLTDPAETGAVTLSLPQDVQAEAWDWEDDLFARRVWHVSRQPVAEDALARAAAVLTKAERPLVVAGGGVIYSDATEALRAFAEATGVPVAESQAGKGSLRYDHPLSVGAIGATGTTAADALAAEADVVIGIGTRYSDFTTGSKTVFGNPDVRFVNLNVMAFDAHKLSAVALVGDARLGLEQLTEALDGWSAPAEHSARATRLAGEWDDLVQQSHDLHHEPLPAQSEVIGVVNTPEPRPGRRGVRGRLHARRPPQDVAHARPQGLPRRVRLLLHGLRDRRRPGHQDGRARRRRGPRRRRDGRRRLLPDDVPGDRHRRAGGRQADRGARAEPRLRLDRRPVRVARVAAVRHALPLPHADRSRRGRAAGRPGRQRRQPRGRVLSVSGVAELEKAFAEAQAADVTTVIHVETDPLVPAPASPAWWDVPVAEVASLESTRDARAAYENQKARQRSHLRPATNERDTR